MILTILGLPRRAAPMDVDILIESADHEMYTRDDRLCERDESSEWGVVTVGMYAS